MHKQAMIVEAIEVKMAALKRACNTEKDAEIKNLRMKQLSEYAQLQNEVLQTKDMLNETTISKQK